MRFQVVRTVYIYARFYDGIALLKSHFVYFYVFYVMQLHLIMKVIKCNKPSVNNGTKI